MNQDSFLSAFIAACVATLTTFMVTKCVLDASWKADAVAVGHAEFYMDQNGARMWRWKGQEK